MILRYEGLRDDFSESLSLYPLVDESVNLVTNPNAEHGAARWTTFSVPSSSASVTDISDWASEGMNSFRLSAEGVTNATAYLTGATGSLDPIVVTAGRRYSARCTFHVPETGALVPDAGVRLALYFYDADGLALEVNVAEFVGDPVGIAHIDAVKAPAGSVRASIAVIVLGGFGNVDVRFDELIVVEGDPIPFFSGDSAGGSWSGVPGASVSVTGTQPQTERKWRYSGNPWIDRGRLVLPGASKLVSARPWEFNASSVLAKLTPGDQEEDTVLSIEVSASVERFHRIAIRGHEVFAEHETDGSTYTQTRIADLYDEDIFWARLLCVDNEVRYALSFDGFLWEERLVVGLGMSGVATLVTLESEGDTSSFVESFDIPANTLGDRLYNMRPEWQYADPQAGYPFLKLCRSLAEAFSDQFQMLWSSEDRRPFEVCLDPDTCPEFALPWLAMISGTTIPLGTSPKEIRQMVKDQRNLRRGRPASLIAAAQSTLTGTKRVNLIERDGSAYRVKVVTEASETPDAAATLAALKATKPAGLVLEHETVTGLTYATATGTYADAVGTYGEQ